MQTDPVLEWRRLSEHYRAMSDEELGELAADLSELTATAQQILRGELHHRGLGEPETALRTLAERDKTEATSALERAEAGARQLAEEEPVEQGVDYTWKTPLCGCESAEQAWQIQEMLRRAAIESWIERPGSTHFVPWVDEGMVGGLQVLVAADELEQARAIAARPIPQDVIDQSMTETPEFEAPACPSCGAADPVLEGVDPVNEWRCEACGREWTEPAVQQSGNPKAAAP